MIIRKATLGDCKPCFELAKAPEFMHPDGSSPRLEWIKAFVSENQIFFVAEESKKIVGFVMGERVTGNLALLHLIIVDKNNQNQGIGKQLLEGFEQEAKKRDAIVVFLYGYVRNVCKNGISEHPKNSERKQSFFDAKNENSLKFFEKNNYAKGSITYEMGKLI